MAGFEIVDTFAEFLGFWDEAQKKPMAEQIEGWAAEYMSHWAELLEKQIEAYCSQGVDWRRIAAEKVFPFLTERLPAMKIARDNLRQACGPVYSKAAESLGFESEVVFVIYVGIGCGAGWATSFRNCPAVLFGVENIAECGWMEQSALTGLIAHEIGHLAHEHWRKEAGLGEGSGPWWQLYSEGFGKRCEHIILGKESWHESTGINDGDWLKWCKENKKWLATEFLKMADSGQTVRPFFGHWYDLMGKKQCGHFLGHELIKKLEKNMTLKEVALLDSIEETFRGMLKKVAGNEETLRGT